MFGYGNSNESGGGSREKIALAPMNGKDCYQELKSRIIGGLSTGLTWITWK